MTPTGRTLVSRNFITHRKVWWIFATGFFEPVFYLFSIGVGVGQLIAGRPSHRRRDPC